MLKTYLYLPEELNVEIKRLVAQEKKSKAAILRAVIAKGIEITKREKTSGAEVLLQIAKTAKKYNVKGPRDASVNHDYYLWGFPKRNPTIKP